MSLAKWLCLIILGGVSDGATGIWLRVTLQWEPNLEPGFYRVASTLNAWVYPARGTRLSNIDAHL